MMSFHSFSFSSLLKRSFKLQGSAAVISNALAEVGFWPSCIGLLVDFRFQGLTIEFKGASVLGGGARGVDLHHGGE